MSNALEELGDLADQVLADKGCDDAKSDLAGLAADVSAAVKEQAQKLVDSKCKSVEQEKP